MPNWNDLSDTNPADVSWDSLSDTPPPPKPEESAWDALKRGATESFQQLPQLARGVQAGIGAAAESAFGEGGIAASIKKSGIEGYKEWGDKIAKNSQDADS